ncbi:hypothetical protein [Bifidobacterium oedipodis]|nr:hypothetical protein [Bifidobacterium sp. DSM 109957]
MANSVYKLSSDPVVLSGNINSARERMTKEWWDSHTSEQAPVQHDAQGRIIRKVEFLTTVNSFGEDRCEARSVKVPDGEWSSKIGKFATVRFVNLTLTVGDLRGADGKFNGHFESLSADDIEIISPGLQQPGFTSNTVRPAATASTAKHEG